MTSHLRSRLRKLEKRFPNQTPGPHRYTDEELADLLAWLSDPDPSREEWAAALLRREALL
ncbi:hypothetical protein [Methylorubrum populi]|uniref:Uncharacterized protein n=1 Tax=Methylorubrum populi TaxID=223967 RepID=A0A833N3J5_9HYPH|nr:hypothetical protein [Methylorubrum populi]KAB7785980.1 hypothetical protein F8B43_1381 [Methylorubrum populi]